MHAAKHTFSFVYNPPESEKNASWKKCIPEIMQPGKNASWEKVHPVYFGILYIIEVQLLPQRKSFAEGDILKDTWIIN